MPTHSAADGPCRDRRGRAGRPPWTLQQHTTQYRVCHNAADGSQLHTNALGRGREGRQWPVGVEVVARGADSKGVLLVVLPLSLSALALVVLEASCTARVPESRLAD